MGLIGNPSPEVCFVLPDTTSQSLTRHFAHKGERGRARTILAVIIHQSGGGGGLRFCNADRRRKERNSRLGRGVEECLGHAKNCSLSDSGAKKWGYRIMQDWKAARNAPSQNANVKVNTMH